MFSFEVFPPKKTSSIDTIYKTLEELEGLSPDFGGCGKAFVGELFFVECFKNHLREDLSRPVQHIIYMCRKRKESDMGEYSHISHEFLPVFDENSKLLVLGSFPSVKSREQGFYYGHPQNRFWKVVAAVYACEVPKTIEEKKQMLLANHIAVWDVIDSCDIIGSSDSSIKNVISADIAGLLTKTNITKIFCNGKTAGNLYEKFCKEHTGIEAVVLPSTSPANAAFSLERLVEAWKDELQKAYSEEKL